jgi:hypothetical protein
MYKPCGEINGCKKVKCNLFVRTAFPYLSAGRTRMQKHLILLAGALTLFISISAQWRLNEICHTNLNQLADEDGDYSDWFELINSGTTELSGEGWFVSDDLQELRKWPLAPLSYTAGSAVLLWASGKSRTPELNHYEVPVLPWMPWHYLLPDAFTPANWRTADFDDAQWQVGAGGFGYGDDDDNTVVPTTLSVFTRITFTLSDPSAAQQGWFSVDYDDAFVAYLNGVEIARGNIGQPGDTPPAWDAFANSEREALGYQGGDYEGFFLSPELLQSALTEGENVLAVQVHNTSLGSSDLTILPALVLGMSTSEIQTELPPDWMALPEIATSQHTNFRLTTGETLYLSDAQGAIMDQLIIPSAETDMSYARQDEEWCFSSTPTPGSANTGVCLEAIAPKPFMLQQAGIYAEQIEVSIVHPLSQAIIHYTTDGSIPDITDPVYTMPIVIESTTVLSARAFAPGMHPSPVEKNTYIINEWGLGLPVISISSNEENLWSDSIGIHVFGPPDYDQNYPHWGANFWENWERLSYVEYFSADSTQQFEGNMGLKIHGGWSRGNSQKSFRLKFRDEYGMQEVNYPLIPDKPHVTSFRGFNLRNGGNAYWDYRCHDAMMQRATTGTHTDYMGYSPVIVFLNGEYWGFMELREILDEDWVESNHGIDTDESTVISYNYMGFNVINGSDASFYPMYETAMNTDPASDEFFPRMAALLDIENYTDYIITQTYWCNGDWSNGWLNNTKFWHDDREGGRWRFMLMDLDFGMGLAGNGPNDNYIQTAGDEWYYTDQIFSRMIQNDAFRYYFINRYADLINTTFQQDRIVSMAEAMRTELIPIFERHAQFIGTDPSNLYWVMDQRLNWNSQRIQGARNVVESHFNLPGQVTVTLDVLPAGAGRIEISTLAPEEAAYPWTGVYFRGVPVKITAIANPGYHFSHWAPNEMFETNVGIRQLEIFLPEDLSFTAVFEGGPESVDLVISEVMYHPAIGQSGGEWVEIYNASEEAVDLSLFTLKDAGIFNDFRLPSGTVLDGERYLVIARDTAAYHAAYPMTSNVIGPYTFAYSNQADHVRLLDRWGHTVAGVAYEDEFPWPLGADGEGRSMERKVYESTPQNPLNWKDGCIGGSPGGPYWPCEPPLVVSEINYRSSPAMDSGDWLELHNRSSSTIDLSGFTLRTKDEVVFSFSPGTFIEAESYLVCMSNEDLFPQRHPETNNIIGPVLHDWDDEGEGILIYNEAGEPIHSVHYLSNPPWPVQANGLGKTLEAHMLVGNPNDASHWVAACDEGSPGVALDSDCEAIVGIESTTGQTFQVYPNPVSDILHWALPLGMYVIEVYSSDGRLQMIEQLGPGAVSDVSEWPSGVYQWRTADGAYRGRFLVK